MQKIKSALDADPDLAAVPLAWKLRKLSFHAGATWEPGAYISPLAGLEPYHETQIDGLVIRCLVGIVDPSNEGDLEAGLETSLARIERVEAIFRNKSGAEAPAALRAITGAASAEGAAFQQSQIESADRFAAAAFRLGYDLSATIVLVQLTAPRFNSSTYGS